MDPVRNFIGEIPVGLYGATETVLDVSPFDTSLLPDNAVDGDYNLVWWNTSDYNDPADDPLVEIVRVTGRTSSTLTIARAQEGTSAQTHNTTGKTYRLKLAMTRKMIDDIRSAVSSVNENISSINSAVGGMGDDIADLNTAIGGINSAVSSMSGDINDINTALAGKTAATTATNTGQVVFFGNPNGTEIKKETGIVEYTSAGTPYTTAIMAESSLISYWKFDGDVTDSKGTAVLTGHITPVFGAARYGNLGNAFNGQEANALSQATAILGANTAGTIEAWVRSNVQTQADNNYIFGEFNFGSATIVLYREASSADLTFAVFKQSSAHFAILTLPEGGNWMNWHHIAATWDSSGMILYLDGVALASNTDSNVFTDQSVDQLVIGGSYWGVNNPPDYLGQFWDGYIDDLALYNAALSPGTIADHYNAGADTANNLNIKAEFQINGYPVIIANPTEGQVLKFNGTAFVNAAVF